MEESIMTNGFVTIATGAEEYYILARNLLHSYRHFCAERLPFAILCDRENECTADFDDVILFPGGASNSYLDKLCLAELAPYDVTIFIDADCLAYGDLNILFDHFAQADDFSCFGRVLPLEDKTGWFEYEHLGDFQSRVSYVVGLHGGIYYMRKGEKSRKLLADARSFVPDYARFQFKGKFSTPGDEPLVALSMAVNQCHPIPFIPEDICCYWEHEGEMSLDIAHGAAKCPQGGHNIRLIHWGTRFTRELVYQKQVALLEILEDGGENQEKRLAGCAAHYDRLIIQERVKHFATRVKNKIRRILKKAKSDK